MSDLIATIRLERVDPMPGCSPLASPTDAVTDSGAAEAASFELADEAELAARRDRYRNRYPMHAAGWWGATR
jgi:hypothetical protein